MLRHCYVTALLCYSAAMLRCYDVTALLFYDVTILKRCYVTDGSAM